MVYSTFIFLLVTVFYNEYTHKHTNIHIYLNKYLIVSYESKCTLFNSDDSTNVVQSCLADRLTGLFSIGI